MLPIRGEANVHKLLMSNLCFVEFSRTKSVVSAPPRLWPVTTVGRNGRGAAPEADVTVGAIPRAASYDCATWSSCSAKEPGKVSGAATMAAARAPGGVYLITFKVL